MRWALGPISLQRCNVPARERHPREEALESYAMGRLSGPRLARLEEHLLICQRCRRRLDQADSFLKAVQGAAAKLLDSFVFVHDTESGPVNLAVVKSPEYLWVARFWGADLEGMREFGGPREAYLYLKRSFAEMFPSHRCTPRCGPRGEHSAGHSSCRSA